MTTERLFRKASQTLATAAGAGMVAAALLVAPPQACAQYSISDSQLQSSVTSTLHNDTKLGGNTITATAAQGVVTLAGTVPNQDALTEAEQVAAGVSGVRSIQDNLSIAGGGQLAAPVPGPAPSSQADAGQTGQPQPAGMPPPPPAESGTAASGMPPAPPSDEAAQQPGYTPYPNGSAPQNNMPQNGAGGQMPPNGYPTQPGNYPGQAQNGYPGQGYPAQGYPGQGYPGQYEGNNGGYGPRGNARPPQAALLAVTPQQQNSSGPVAIAPGTLLSVRTTQPLSTQNLKGGEYFQVTAASDLYVNGVVAVPRGAVLTGQVIQSKNAGPFGGSPRLDLKLTSMQLGATTYPVVSDVWSSQGPSKTGYTATNAAGGALFGALVGAIAGGGVGAGVGAIAGGATGAAVSGATHGPRLTLPPEALLQFHIVQPLTIQPMHYEDAVRVAASAPQQPPVLRQRPAYAYPYPVRPYPYGYPPY